MSKWLTLAVVALMSGLTGWHLGLNRGADERRDLVTDLPAQQAYWAAKLDELAETGEMGRVCNQIFDLVNEYEREARELEAISLDAINERSRLERD